MPKEKICGIYKITNQQGKIYIGQSVDCFGRKKCYSKSDCVNQKRIYNSIRKYGWQSHKFEIIHKCSPEELNYWEKYYVDLYQTFNSEIGLNLKDGGGAHGKHSDETKKIISEKGKGRKLSEDTKQKLSKIFKGRIISESHRKKISDTLMGHKNSASERHREIMRKLWRERKDEISKKISISNSGKKRTEKQRKKMIESFNTEEARKNRIESHLGQKAWNKGVPMTEEMKQRIRITKTGTHWGNHSEESKLKMSLAAKGKPKSKEAKKKMSEYHKENGYYTKCWADPEKRKVLIEKQRAGWMKRKQGLFQKEVDLFNEHQKSLAA